MTTSILLARVTQVAPLRIRLENDLASLPFTPRVIGEGTFRVGQVVTVVDVNHQLWVQAPAGGAGFTPGVTPIATVNGLWTEELLSANFYRWTQFYSVTTAISTAWGQIFTSADLPLPAKPAGATIKYVTVSVMETSGNYTAMTTVRLGTWTVVLVRGSSYTSSAAYPLVITCYGTKP